MALYTNLLIFLPFFIKVLQTFDFVKIQDTLDFNVVFGVYR